MTTETVGMRAVDGDVYPVECFYAEFVRSNLTDKRRNQPLDMAKAERALTRWAMRKVQRKAREAGSGLAYSRPQMDYQYDPAWRATRFYPSVEFALLHNHPGVTHFMPKAPIRWQPL